MDPESLQQSPPHLPSRERQAAPTWEELGDSFETLGKVGLAMAVGFSAASLFCRLAQQGKIKVPTVATLLAPPSSRSRSR